MNKNKGKGGLKIRAYVTDEVFPIVGLKVVVSTISGDNKIIFYEGETDESGMIKELFLPAPAANDNDLVVPTATTYSIETTYVPDNKIQSFPINMYDGVCVVQNIVIIPDVKENRIYGN